MNRIVEIVDALFKTTMNGVLDVMAKHLKKPMPQPFNWCIVYTFYL